MLGPNHSLGGIAVEPRRLLAMLLLQLRRASTLLDAASRLQVGLTPFRRGLVLARHGLGCGVEVGGWLTTSVILKAFDVGV